MARTNTVGSHKTAVFNSDGMTRIVYHTTEVVKFNQSIIVLNSGGWRSNTTKARMNQASNQFDLGYCVYQNNFEWFVDFDGKTLDFSDGMTLSR
jgi:exopolysaccharide biosynthesis protein